MNQRICIVANGRLYENFIKEVRTYDVVIGVDHAAHWLITHGIIPDVAIGDFDSVTKDEMNVIRQKVKTIKHFKPEKDYTDTELALQFAFRLHPSAIVLFGGSGTRLDHTIGTIQLLEQSAKHSVPAVFRDETNELVLLTRGRTILTKREGYRYVSILPVTSTIQVTLLNFKYEIDHQTIYRGQTIGISNEFTGRQAEVIIHRGKALLIQSRD